MKSIYAVKEQIGVMAWPRSFPDVCCVPESSHSATINLSNRY
jgi:hypothetical protein